MTWHVLQEEAMILGVFYWLVFLKIFKCFGLQVAHIYAADRRGIWWILYRRHQQDRTDSSLSTYEEPECEQIQNVQRHNVHKNMFRLECFGHGEFQKMAPARGLDT